ncbi:Divergent AAA domain protein [Allorhodopirellula solitaria]|uniref:Divergent AAA domain protein n=1 Tax=Allorhodopirellula solitaria TaxID=2527987 RepID=A0A5C5XVY2_9BACT|nr:Divergent AAA domain protein [Allorhodopirellula solitaria]
MTQLADLPSAPDEAFVRDCIARGEDLHTEFKSNVPSFFALGQIISAFANADGGVVLLGIREPDQIVGVDWATLSRVFDRAMSSLSGGPNIYLHRVSTSDGDVGVVVVRPSTQAVVSAGGAFIREADRMRPLTADELRTKLGDIQGTAEADIGNSIAELTQVVQDMSDQLAQSRSFRAQLPGYMIGFLLGIIASVIASVIFASNLIFRIFE